MMRKIPHVCLLLSLLVTSASHAQERVAASGTVTDPSGGVVPGALVEALTATALGYPGLPRSAMAGVRMAFGLR